MVLTVVRALFVTLPIIPDLNSESYSAALRLCDKVQYSPCFEGCIYKNCGFVPRFPAAHYKLCNSIFCTCHRFPVADFGPCSVWAGAESEVQKRMCRMCIRSGEAARYGRENLKSDTQAMRASCLSASSSPTDSAHQHTAAFWCCHAWLMCWPLPCSAPSWLAHLRPRPRHT